MRILLLTTKFWKPIQQLEANQAPQTFLHQLPVQGVVSSHPRPPVPYNCCVSVLSKHCRIDPTTLQLIGEICTCRYASTSATGWLQFSNVMLKQLNCQFLVAVDPSQLLIMSTKTIDPIDWSLPLTFSRAVLPKRLLQTQLLRCSREANPVHWENCLH